MDIFKTIFLRLIALCTIAIGLNYVYAALFFEKDLEKHSDIYPKIKAIPPTSKVLYLGESSNVTFRATDIDKRPISELISDYYPDLNVSAITQPGAHAGSYLAILQAIPKSTALETIVLTLNYRSFGADWIYSELETALAKKIVLLKDHPTLYKRFNLSFKTYEKWSEQKRKALIQYSWRQEFKNNQLPYSTTAAWNIAKNLSGVIDSVNNHDYDKTALACSFIKSFAFEIEPENPRIKDFDAIALFCKKRNWNLVLNLMPEDLEQANNLVGGELVSLMEKNQEILISRYTQMGATVVDNFKDVPHFQFIDKDFPTEHYAIKGRRIIAKNVANNLKILYPNFYRTVAYSPKYDSRFFHDCEKLEVWGQMQSIITFPSDSNNHVSVFGKENPFSITLEYPFKKIQDSTKNSIQIQFRTRGNALPDKTMLAVELSGNDLDFLWLGESFSKLLSKQHTEWQTVSFEIEIPESHRKADLIKIYAYNPNDYLYYIDDISIEFK